MKLCKVCDKDISHLHKSRLFCNNKCRNKYYYRLSNPNCNNYDNKSINKTMQKKFEKSYMDRFDEEEQQIKINPFKKKDL